VLIAQSDARGHRDARHLNGGRAFGGGPIPELTEAVVAPALDFTVRQHGTRVFDAQSDDRSRRDARHLNGSGADDRSRRDARHLNVDVNGGAVSGGPVPKLAEAVPAPAIYLAVHQ
jgi:hypothetical protein